MCVSRVGIFNNIINEKCTRFTDSFAFRDNRGKTDAVFKWCSVLSCLLLSFPVAFFHIFFLHYLTPLQDTARRVSHKLAVAIN